MEIAKELFEAVKGFKVEKFYIVEPYIEYSRLNWVRDASCKINLKASDWVRLNNSQVIQVSRMDGTTIRTACGNTVLNTENLVKWTPTKGEWCVFKDRDTSHFIVDTFDETKTFFDEGINTQCDKHWGGIHTDEWFHEVYPLEFIQTLKEIK